VVQAVEMKMAEITGRSQEVGYGESSRSEMQAYGRGKEQAAM